MLLKRIFDIVAAIFGLLLTLPLLLFVAVLIKIAMPGPVFFLQDRVGYKARIFRIIKFRTMKVNKSKISITLSTDDRITPLGHLLRKTKIDELPQLWNILKGDMSFVGPRPDVPEYANSLTGDDRRIFSVRPGLSGLGSVKYPDEEELLVKQSDPIKYYGEVLFPDKVRIGINYIKYRSFVLDIRVILKTIFRRKFKEPWLN